MNHRILTTLSLALLVIVSPAFAQEGPPSNYKHLKQVGWLVGEWTATTKAQKALPGVFEEGDTIKARLSGAWRAKKNAIGFGMTATAKGVAFSELAGLIGWNAAEKSIVSSSFNSQGGHGRGVWSVKGEEWRNRMRGIDAGGKLTIGTLVFSDITDTSFVSQSVNQQQDGKKMPDGPRTVWKRLK